MFRDPDRHLTVVQRRRARRLGYWNGAVWAIGNGLAGTTLVVYLALELGAGKIGLGISLILAARHVVGILRLGAPAMIGRVAERKTFCLGMFLLSTLVLCGLPWIAAPGRLPTAADSLAALIAVWCVYHLLQYLAMVALWSWLADLVPLRIRGRFLGQRRRWMVAGEAAAAICCGLFVWGWQQSHPTEPKWIAYAVPATLGACFMFAALVPLWKMPAAATGPKVHSGATLRAMAAPFADSRFLRLVAFGCWFAFFNGVTQSAQHIYPAQVLGVGLFSMLVLHTGMRCGQLTLSPRFGVLADRLGNRPVMLVSLAVAASGPFFFLLSTIAQPWWFAMAWIVWIAYAGLNVCLPNLMLKLSPGDSNSKTPYIAMYFTITGLCYAAATIAGGWMLDLYRHETFTLPGIAVELDFFQCSFLFGWITRSLGVGVLLLVVEESS